MWCLRPILAAPHDVASRQPVLHATMPSVRFAPTPVSRRIGVGALLLVAAALALALALHGPVVQWAGYHLFADARSWLGIPNAENVLSNLPFALIGMWGWRVHARSNSERRRAWCAFAVALVGTALGSAWYHWAPGNGALVFDRLPIAWACALLACTLLAERVDARWVDAQTLTAALVLATASVATWWLSEGEGKGDLRAYLFVQFLPMLLAPAAILLRLPARDPQVLRAQDWWCVLGLYATAKLAELADQPLLHAVGFTSGHTLKHLLAAAAALWLLRAAAREPADQLR